MSIGTDAITVTESFADGDDWVTVERVDRLDPSKGSREVARVPVSAPASYDDRLAALEAKAAEADTLKAVLVDKGVIAEADVAVALDAEVVVKP